MNRVIENKSKDIVEVTLFYSESKQPTRKLFAGDQMDIPSDDLDKLIIKLSCPMYVSKTMQNPSKSILGKQTTKKNKLRSHKVTETTVESNCLKINLKDIESSD